MPNPPALDPVVHPARRSWACGLLAALALGAAVSAPAATFTVLNTDDSGPGSLRQAILDANASPGADTIAFAPSVMGTIAQASPLPTISDEVDVVGPGASILTISDGGSHVLEIGSLVTATISGLTVADGGVGIVNRGTLTIDGCTLTRNSAPSGGGVHNGRTVTIKNSVFSDNVAGLGGGLFNSGTALVEGSVFSNNRAMGAGIYNIIGTTTVRNSVFSGNLGVFRGGAITNDFALGPILAGTILVEDSTLSNNTVSQGGGGGVYNGGTATIRRTTISGNTTAGPGGGILNNGTLTILNSTISGNSSPSTGGGILNDLDFADRGGPLRISYSTIVDNVSPVAGLVHQNPVDPLEIKSSIVAGNDAADCANPGGGPSTAVGVNQATDASCSGFFQVTSDDLALGPLIDNGGPTPTHALLPGSVAIDAASDCTDLDGGAVLVDQRGSPRFGDGDEDGFPGCDLGAYEVFAARATTEIPTLGEWASGFLVLLLAGTGLLALRRARSA